ncbi:MarR family transcriptional regulator [Sphingomonas sinipercae]|uniref:MarR family transcriptional regulator n=1 Tax=Sphingomonas sinipercae TaxID=2714944 RepID=A0A6G7ZNX7_9SPHN|nr:MarR family transcriptional regulator [Sphingomonas sinipercae]QIL02628.1 MarR family transcriptional regulator [Sphingomonas sinipercae]
MLFEINETAHAIRRAFDQRAASLGVTKAQWRVLARLKREPGLRQVELADKLDVEPITLCRIVDRLEEAGLVERHRDPSDRRAWKLELTDKAEPVVARLRELVREFSSEILGSMGPAGVENLRAELKDVRAKVAAGQHKNRVSA